MRHEAVSVPAAQPSKAERSVGGPRLLDSSLLMLVSGGSPRGGWSEPESVSLSPRGGWSEPQSVSLSPRGGW
jgi:hypothetical protein